MQHTKTCLVTCLPTNNYGVLYFPLFWHYGVAQIRPLADKIFYSSKATVHICSHTVVEISRFFDFSRWRPPPFWIFKISKFLTVVTVKKVELHHCAKFHRNRSNRGRDMRVSILCWFGLKMPIHAPFCGFLGHISPEWCHSSSLPQKGPSLGWTTSFEP